MPLLFLAGRLDGRGLLSGRNGNYVADSTTDI
jgi:hypothetical protein